MANALMATQADRNLNWFKGTTFTAAPTTLWQAVAVGNSYQIAIGGLIIVEC